MGILYLCTEGIHQRKNCRRKKLKIYQISREKKLSQKKATEVMLKIEKKNKKKNRMQNIQIILANYNLA